VSAAGADTGSPSARRAAAHRPLRILFVARYYYWWSGPNVGMLHLAMSPIGLQRRGHDVRFVCERRPGQRFDDDGVDVRSFDPPLSIDLEARELLPRVRHNRVSRAAAARLSHMQSLLGLWRTGLRACENWRPDIIYCQAEPVAPVAAALARHCGVPWVLHAYGGGSVTMSQVQSRWWRASRFADFVYAYRSSASAFLVVDDGTGADALARALGASPEKTHHWTIPVALPSAPAIPTHRSRLGIPPDAPVVIAAARMVPIKRMDLCLQACAEALERVPDAHALLVGDGPERLSMLRRAEALPPSLRRRIHFTGYVDRDTLSEILQEADVFLTMQEVSVSGTNLRDALLHGTCVLAIHRSQDLALGALVTDGVNGRTVPEADLASIGLELAELLRDPLTTRRLGDAARCRAEETFETWPRRIEAEERLLRDIVERGTKA
jgi:glycosyltransferase involved in cell wall biosynthesis